MFTTLKSPTFKRFWSIWKYCWNDSKCTQRGRLSWPVRTAFAPSEDGFRGPRNGTLSMAKWYFVNGKVVLCRKECVTLSAKMWHFWREEQSFSAIPPHFGDENLLQSRCTKGLEAWGGCAWSPSWPQHIPLLFGHDPSHKFICMRKGAKKIAQARIFSLKNLQTAKKICIFAIA